jgi:GalNAc-alpha-(1->4)-GalNAc-alpha-(1->3)-diNAcBac-PP-undecaprenol alpha-1,4-N-acetyl-D-galactosaminyltransferase
VIPIIKKHICFFLPSIGVGGAERVVSNLANYLVSLDYKVTIICLVDNIAYPVDKKVCIICPKFRLTRDITTLFRVIKYYRSIIRRIEPDVILSFLEFYNEITMLSLLGIKKTIYLFDRNNPFLKEQNTAQSILRKILYPRANGVVVQTRHAADYYKKLKYNSNIYVLPNPKSEVKVLWDCNSKRKTIICVGRMESQKNQKYLIDVFAQIKNNGWILRFVGDGRLRQENEKYVEKLNLKNQVEFMGIRSDIQSILSESTIFAFPSLWEGFPNALLEAMAIGVPCISNNCPTGPSEIIQDGVNGFLVEVNDIEDFKKKLLILMEDSEKRIAFSGNARVGMNKYAIANIADELLNIIEE